MTKTCNCSARFCIKNGPGVSWRTRMFVKFVYWCARVKCQRERKDSKIS